MVHYWLQLHSQSRAGWMVHRWNQLHHSWGEGFVVMIVVRKGDVHDV